MVNDAPRFDAPTAADIARDVYGFDATAEPLPSERDQNFLLQGTSFATERPPSLTTSPYALPEGEGKRSDSCLEPSSPGNSNDRFVLKIANSEEAFEFL